MLEINCTELTELGEHYPFGKDVSESTRYPELCLMKRMRPHSLKFLQPKKERNRSEMWEEFVQKPMFKKSVGFVDKRMGTVAVTSLGAVVTTA